MLLEEFVDDDDAVAVVGAVGVELLLFVAAPLPLAPLLVDAADDEPAVAAVDAAADDAPDDGVDADADEACAAAACAADEEAAAAAAAAVAVLLVVGAVPVMKRWKISGILQNVVMSSVGPARGAMCC